MRKNIKYIASFLLLSLSLASLATLATFKGEAKTAKADDLLELHTNFKLDWDAHTELSADTNGYKSFTASGNDTVLSGRVAGTILNLYDDTYSTYENPSPKYQVTPYSGYKAVQIRNYKNSGSTYYLYLEYGNKYDGSERDYGNFIEFTPLGSKNTVIKSLKIGTRDGNSVESLWYKTSSNGTDWVGDLTNTYKLPFTAGTKSYDLSIPTGAKYLRVYQCNNATQDLRKEVVCTQFSIGYEEEGSIKVTFDSQNGSATSSQSVNSGDHLIEPSVPTKNPINGHRYEFLGWFTESVGGTQWDFENDTVSSAMTLYAHWNDVAVSEYTVTYVSNGDSPIASETVGVGEYFSEPEAPEKTSDDPRYVYSFDAWCTNEELTSTFDFNTLPTEDITLYGRFIKSIADRPAGTYLYNVKTHKPTDEPYASAVPSYANYASRVMDSRQTFDYGSESRPQIFLDVQGADDGYGVKKGKSGGEGTSEYDVVIKNSVINLTWADETKVLSFVRFQFHRINYQTYAPSNITLKVTGSDQVLSTCVIPGGTNHTDEDCVQASFTAEQDVRGVTISVLDTHVYVDMRYVVLGFVDETVDAAAVKYATKFNDANVCGTLDTDGLNETKWNEQAEIFDDLDQDIKDYLKEYEGSNEEIVECLERYDRVVSLHGASYDFMGRIAAGKISGIKNITPVFDVTNNTLTVVITVVSLLAVSTILIYVYTKSYQKKRQK